MYCPPLYEPHKPSELNFLMLGLAGLYNELKPEPTQAVFEPSFSSSAKLAPELTGWLGLFRPLISNKIQSEQREVCHVWPVWILQLSLDNVQDECSLNQIELVRPYLKHVINKFMHRFAWLRAWYEKHCNSCYFLEGWWWGFAKSTRWSSTHRNRDSRIYCWEVKMLVNLLN